ncbi:MAG: hypothetical protein OK454_07795 [Thaumarchaeota archaeon]|nr:hypothetical protein [Nitrososphaerota archaeon]
MARQSPVGRWALQHLPTSVRRKRRRRRRRRMRRSSRLQAQQP